MRSPRDASSIPDIMDVLDPDHSYGIEIMRLRVEVRRLRQDLEDQAILIDGLLGEGHSLKFPAHLGLNPQQKRFVRLLMLRGHLSRDQMYAALFATQANKPHEKIMMVLASQIRRKLAFVGVIILSGNGLGFTLPPESIAILRVLSKTAGGE